VSGHGSAEELKIMLNLTQPTYFLPVHGETRHLHAHARLAASVGVAEQNIFVLDNGDCLELSEDGARVAEHVESGTVYVDGLSVGDIGHVILRDRQMLASDGVALVIVAIDSQNGRVVSEPEIVVRGFVLSGSEDEDVLTELRGRVAKVLARTSGEGATDHGVIKKALRDSLSSFIWERSRSRPMIIPVVMEV
jgi:ribonuclease J